MLTLASQPRTKKDPLKSLREGGAVPGVLYGPAIQPASLSVNSKELQKSLEEAGESTLLTLSLNSEDHLVLIRDAQRNAVTDEIVHVDFYQPRLDEEIDITVALEFEGEPSAVKELGGTFVKYLHEVEVRALPQNLPHEIRVSVEGLKEFGDQIFVKDLVTSDQYKILAELDEVVAGIEQPEKVEEELAVPVEENMEAVAVEEKGKKEEEEQPASPEEAS